MPVLEAAENRKRVAIVLFGTFSLQEEELHLTGALPHPLRQDVRFSVLVGVWKYGCSQRWASLLGPVLTWCEG